MEKFNQQQFIELLMSSKGKWSEISRKTGLHYNTIRGIAVSKIPNPGMLTVNKILEGMVDKPA